jgi:hypothetical protein
MTLHDINFLEETLTLESEIVQETEDPGMWRITIDILSNSIGSIALFVINDPLDTFLGTASPMQEDGVPVFPALNEDGEGRISTIRFRHAMLGDAEGAISGVLNDLEEYLRSKVIFRDHMDSIDTFVIGTDQ